MTVNIEEFGDVWVFIETHDGAVAPVSWELLTEAESLIEQKPDEELVAIVIGEEVHDVAEEAIARGADRALVADDPVFEPYRSDPYGDQFRHLVEERQPEIVLIGGTTTGRDFAGRVAVPIHAGLTADCTEIGIGSDGHLEARRPAFGGNILATIKCEAHRPQMATIRPGVFSAAEPTADQGGEIEYVDVVVDESQTKTAIIERVVGETADITDAERVVAVGGGVDGDLSVAKDLARVLEADLAASRKAVDEGWIEHARQVGQTGKTVRPTLYVALGISGAVQHLEGMNDSEIVVAINSDPNAPIFDNADYGIVGDLFEIVPTIVESLEGSTEPTEAIA